MSDKSQVKCAHCGKWVNWLDAFYFFTAAYCTREAQLEAMHKYFNKMKRATNEKQVSRAES